ncbi:hypothetical protein MNBD_GAMMA16-1733 [hydrothermal vent metagenome]|uniref:Uncharacterized protein n=1 Tax=hydrothermal vent metagenome TaxID=652676 RepID=A0A3B0Z2Y9_9ZZZZ
MKAKNIMNLQGLTASDEQLFPLTNDQKTELDSYSVDPDAGDSWVNVKNRMSNHLVNKS